VPLCRRAEPPLFCQLGDKQMQPNGTDPKLPQEVARKLHARALAETGGCWSGRHGSGSVDGPAVFYRTEPIRSRTISRVAARERVEVAYRTVQHSTGRCRCGGRRPLKPRRPGWLCHPLSFEAAVVFRAVSGSGPKLDPCSRAVPVRDPFDPRCRALRSTRAGAALGRRIA
jgi:hypothetical protein